MLDWNRDFGAEVVIVNEKDFNFADSILGYMEKCPQVQNDSKSKTSSGQFNGTSFPSLTTLENMMECGAWEQGRGSTSFRFA